MNPQRLHRVSTVVIVFVVLNAGFIISGVAQDTMMAAASGYTRGILMWKYRLEIPIPLGRGFYDGSLDRIWVGIFGLMWMGMMVTVALIVFRDITRRSILRAEPVLWWFVMAYGCLLAGGLATYLLEFQHATKSLNPGTPAHFSYPLSLMLLACLGLKTFRHKVSAREEPGIISLREE